MNRNRDYEEEQETRNGTSEAAQVRELELLTLRSALCLIK